MSNQKPKTYCRYTKIRDYKHSTPENHQIPKEESKRRTEQRNTNQLENTSQNGNSRVVPMNDYLKCTWTKSSFKRHECIKKKKNNTGRPSYILPIGNSLLL